MFFPLPRFPGEPIRSSNPAPVARISTSSSSFTSCSRSRTSSSADFADPTSSSRSSNRDSSGIACAAGYGTQAGQSFKTNDPTAAVEGRTARLLTMEMVALILGEDALRERHLGHH